MKRTTAARAAAFALAAAVTMSACSQEEPATFDDTAQQESAADEAAPADEEGAADDTAADGDSTGDAPDQDTADQDSSSNTGEQENVSDDSAAAAGVNLADLGDPIATATVPATVEGDNGASMEVSLYSLTRDGRTLTGIYSFRVDSAGGDEKPRWIYHYLGSQSWTPHLIDTTNLARHDVLSATSTRAMTDSQGSMFRPGQTFYAYASFAAPEEDVSTMTVSLVDGAPAATEVPIQ